MNNTQREGSTKTSLLSNPLNDGKLPKIQRVNNNQESSPNPKINEKDNKLSPFGVQLTTHLDATARTVGANSAIIVKRNAKLSQGSRQQIEQTTNLYSQAPQKVKQMQQSPSKTALTTYLHQNSKPIAKQKSPLKQPKNGNVLMMDKVLKQQQSSGAGSATKNLI